MRFPRKGLAPRGLRRAVPVPASAGQGSSWPSVSPDHSLVGGRTFPARSPGSGQARHPDEADNRRPRRVKSAPMIGQSLDRSGGCWAPLRKSDQGISAEMAGSSSSGKRHLGAWRLAKSRRRPKLVYAVPARAASCAASETRGVRWAWNPKAPFAERQRRTRGRLLLELWW